MLQIRAEKTVLSADAALAAGARGHCDTGNRRDFEPTAFRMPEETTRRGSIEAGKCFKAPRSRPEIAALFATKKGIPRHIFVEKGRN